MLIVKCIPRKGTDRPPDKHSFVKSFALLLTLTIRLSNWILVFDVLLLFVSHCSPRCFELSFSAISLCMVLTHVHTHTHTPILEETLWLLPSHVFITFFLTSSC